MSDVDPSAGARAKGFTATAKDDGGFIDLTKGVRTTATTTTPQGNEVLAWLAGNRMRILDGKDDMRPRSRAETSQTDKLLGEPKPADPVEAANKRASVLTDLRRESPKDPRVEAVFEADPLVAEDPSTGKIVTTRMLRARGDIFDAVLTMLGRPAMTRAARSWLAVRLTNAFTVLSPAAQDEWARSEVRLEETKLFLERRTQREMNALGEQLDALMEAQDIWAAARAFTIAAHLGVSAEGKSAQLADLLELREFGAD